MKPILKWAGGKRQLAKFILPLIPKGINKYYEPFFGGGAIFFELSPKKSILNDINTELINLYKVFLDSKLLEEFIALLRIHEKNHSKEYFYKIREMDRMTDFLIQPKLKRAARILYLNKSCFNGLYRVNSEGYFNVPFNNAEKVNLVDELNFREISNFFASNEVTFYSEDFEKIVSNSKKGDFVYFDPPYDVLRDKQSFTTYAKDSFGELEQTRLARVCTELDNRGVQWLLSNHNTPLINSLYSKFKINVIQAKRMINSKANQRGHVDEVLIKNY